jgi:hypothetical protein
MKKNTENEHILNWLIRSNADSYFHDGEVMQIENINNTFSFWVYSAELFPEDVPEPFNLGEINNLVGKIHVSDIRYITINGKSVNTIESNHLTTGNISNLELNKNCLKIELLPEFHAPGEYKDRRWTEIIIEMNKVRWENLAHKPILVTKLPKWPYNPLFDNLSIFHKAKIHYVNYRRDELMIILETKPVRKNSKTKLTLTEERKTHGKLIFRNLVMIEENDKKIDLKDLNIDQSFFLYPSEGPGGIGGFYFSVDQEDKERDFEIICERAQWENLAHIPLEDVISHDKEYGY